MIAWHPGLVEHEGEIYYFVGDAQNGGNKLADGDVWVTRTNGIAGYTAGSCYTFEAGKLTVKEGVVDGKYYEDSAVAYGKGLVKIGENYIYVRSNGDVVVSADYYVPENDLGIVPGRYSFDENGYMIEPETTVKNGVVDGTYYINGAVVYGAGLIKIGEDVYYVRSNGQVATGEYYITNTNGIEGYFAGQKLVFDENGKAAPVKNGVVDGTYYVNGEVACGAGLIEWNDNVYYVRSNGKVATGEYYITNTNDLEGYTFGQKLYFDNKGALIVE